MERRLGFAAIHELLLLSGHTYHRAVCVIVCLVFGNNEEKKERRQGNTKKNA